MSEVLTLTEHPYLKGVFLTRSGRVFQELSVSNGHGGYAYLHVERKTVRRHVLVAETFHGPRPAGHVVRHKNGKARDDRATNVCWGTQADNCADTVKHGRSTKGVRSSQAKLTAAQVKEIKRRLRSGESGSVLSAEFRISQPVISEIKTGKLWTHIR